MSESALDKAEKLMQAFLRGKEVHDHMAKKLVTDLLISDYPMTYWKEKFRIQIPHDDLNPAICRDIDLQLIKKNQEASFYFAEANAKLEVITRSGDSVSREKFFAIVQDFKERGEKLPAASTLDKLAKLEGDDLDSACSIATVEKMFWKDILEYLSTCRKLIENATWNNRNEVTVNNAKNYGATDTDHTYNNTPW